MSPVHVPVLREESVRLLNLPVGGRAVDATLGLGGHTKEMLRVMGSSGVVLGIEPDEDVLQHVIKIPGLIPVKGNYTYMDSFVREYDVAPVDGVLFDLGVNAFHLDESLRGFSFRTNTPLDMRFDRSGEVTAADIVNTAPKDKLVEILRTYGGEQRAFALADAIIEARKQEPIVTTGKIVEIVEQVYEGHRGRIHPATKTFQALRIAVNNEIENIRNGIAAAVSILKSGGRLAIISYHSLEHKAVKAELRGYAEKALLKFITKSAVRPGALEIQENPRARSAQLRVAEVL